MKNPAVATYFAPPCLVLYPWQHSFRRLTLSSIAASLPSWFVVFFTGLFFLSLSSFPPAPHYCTPSPAFPSPRPSSQAKHLTEDARGKAAAAGAAGDFSGDSFYDPLLYPGPPKPKAANNSERVRRRGRKEEERASEKSGRK